MNNKYPTFSKQVFEREAFRDIQPAPNKNIKNTENTKEGAQERIRDGDYSLNN